MSRALAFKGKLGTFGEDVVVRMKPSTDPANKCTCWQYDYPNPDCPLCDGTGYTTHPALVNVKAFILPLAGDKELDLDIGVARAGTCNAYFSPDFNLDGAEEATWDGVLYRVNDVDRVAVAGEIIYRNCKLERVD